MSEEMDREAVQNKIEEAYASLQQLQSMFEGREIPLSVARVERGIRAQLQAAQAQLAR
jgi:hypothetical protein